MLQSIKVPIAAGELIDKITILEIKIADLVTPARWLTRRPELILLEAMP